MISISPFFNSYYATVFLILGAIFLNKFFKKNKVELDGNTRAQNMGVGSGILHIPFDLRKSRILSEKDNIRVEVTLRFLEYTLAATIFLAGVVCSFLEEDWFHNIPYELKVIPYCFIGVSVSFTSIISCLDFLEYMKEWNDWLFGYKRTSMVVSNFMYLIVIGFSMTLGVMQGFLFGMSDIEDISNKFLMFQITEVFEMYLMLPISMYIGAICGYLFVTIR